MKKILYLVPHLSTGGLPSVALKKIQNLIDFYEVIVVEYQDLTAGIFTVHKNKIISLLDSKYFITLSENKNQLLKIIEEFNPDYIHLEEIPECFMSNEIATEIYKKDRNYYITETTHNVNFNVSYKRFLPDKFMHVSDYIADKYKIFDVPYEVIEYPIEYKERPNREEALKKLGLNPEYKHVLNVGLFTPGKNQKQIFDIARLMKDEKIQFHFVGNQAGNFQDYWLPLMQNKPDNCIVHGERSDVDNFYSAMDLFLFTSIHELNPIAVKEALSWNMKILMYNLEPYGDKYIKNDNVYFLKDDDLENVKLIKNLLYNNKEEYPKRCYITHTTKNYIETTFGLIYSLLEYSNYPIVIFTINFDISEVKNPFFNNKKVYFVKYIDESLPNDTHMIEKDDGKYVDRSVISTYKILTAKPRLLLKAFEMGIKDGVYLDSDSVARYNIDDLMLEIKNVKDYPLFTRGVYDIMMFDGKMHIERPMMDYLGVKGRSMKYVQSNIVVFTDKCKDFIKEWKDTCDDKIILNNFEEWAPYQDETVANVLLWKHGYTEHLPMYHFNIRNLEFVKEFEAFDDTDKSKYSEQMLGFPFYINKTQMTWSYIPYNKEDVKIFHGIKDLNEMIDIIEYQNRIKGDICVVQICDDLYKPLADITFNINKEYCKKHGYDYIGYKGSISDDIRIHWQKYIAIKRHLRNYKWIFFMDTDMMFMNWKIKLEELIDDRFNIIMDSTGDREDLDDLINSKFVDPNYNVITCAMFIKNTKMSFNFLNDVIDNKIDCKEILYDNGPVRCIIGSNEEYKKYTKVFPVDSKKFHTTWYTNKPSYILHDGPKWNDNANMFEKGDFTIHIVAYDVDERVSLMKQFLPYIIKE